MKKSTRLGFSFWELLVVIAILAVLAMLIIPAIMNVRAAQARVRTGSILRQCAIAVHNYHGTFKRFPNAASTAEGAGLYSQPGEERSIWFHLLPFVEQQDVYKNNIHNAANITYVSPADPYVRVTGGKISVAANIRLFGYQTLGKDVADSAVGAGGTPTGSTLADHLAATMICGLTLFEIKDGSSNTFMLATRYADCGSPVQSTYYSASPIGTMLTGGGPVPSVGAPTSPAKGAFFGAGTHDQPADRSSIRAMFQIAPTRETCLADDSVFGHAFGPNGLTVALADASIRSVDPSISTTTFCRALCPSDGYLLDNDWTDGN